MQSVPPQKPEICDCASRNPLVSPERVLRFVTVVKNLEQSGVLKVSGYRLSPPLNGGHEALKAIASRGVEHG